MILAQVLCTAKSLSNAILYGIYPLVPKLETPFLFLKANFVKRTCARITVFMGEVPPDIGRKTTISANVIAPLAPQVNFSHYHQNYVKVFQNKLDKVEKI